MKNILDIWGKIKKILNREQKFWGLVVVILSFIGAVMEMLGVSIIVPLVQVMLEPTQLMEYGIVGVMCDKIDIDSTQQLLILCAIGVIFIYIVKNAFLAFLSWVRVKYSTKVQRELSIKMLKAYTKRGYTFFRQTNSATLLRGITGAVVGVNDIIYQFMKIISEVLTILCICTFIVYTDIKLAASMVLLVGACLLFILVLFKGVMNSAGKAYYNNMGLANKSLMQLFGGIKEVLVFGRKDYFVNSFVSVYSKQQKEHVRRTVASECPAYIIEGVCVMGIIVAVCFRVSDMEDTAMYIPKLASFAVAAFRLLPSVGRISSSFNNCVFSLPAVNEVYENILEAEHYDLEHKEVEKNIITKEVEFKEKVEIQDVSWKYPDGDENILDRVSITINKGESIAFVGPSGAGKSTFADIILGLFQPQEGSIIVDGKYHLNNTQELASLISFVPQAVYLIDDTIRRNVAFGITDDIINDELIWSVLEKAQMKKYVEELPDGLDTIIGERGVKFSGGQAQRLAIARALYKKPEILVLDEATSALDGETEAAVMEAIEALQGKITLIIIAHRLTTIKNCDKIYEINNGKAIRRMYEELIS